MWNCDATFEVPPQATPVMKTPSSDTLILPIKFNLKPGRDENSKDHPISKITETVQQVQHCTSTPSEGLHNNKRNSKKGDLKLQKPVLWMKQKSLSLHPIKLSLITITP